MTTVRQVEANRRNAQFSTGPKSPAGKAKARYNAMKHGLLAQAALLPDEDEATFNGFRDRLQADLAPQGEYELMQFERIINNVWRLRRLSQTEAGLFVLGNALETQAQWAARVTELEVTQDEYYNQPPPLMSIRNEEWHAEALVHEEEAGDAAHTELAMLGSVFANDAAGPDAFSKLARYETQLNRALDRALQALSTHQANRSPADAPPEAT